MRTVCFAHGKESGPWGTKITVLARVARARGWEVQSIDFTSTFDPDRRVEMMLAAAERRGEVVLVGSSMGGYVATMASRNLEPAGLFLLAPAFYLSGYAEQDPAPLAKRTEIVHGWRDSVVPPANVVRFAGRYRATLHLLDAGHTLVEVLGFLEECFGRFLDGGERLQHEATS